jgi:hypothetical protein
MSDSVRSLVSILWNEFETDPGSYFGDYSSQTAYDQADRENLIVILPANNQLFVDIDSDLGYAKYQRHLPLLQKFYEVIGVAENPSKSGEPGHRHITISLGADVDQKERLILQAFLGSDVKREFLGLQRIRIKDPAPTLFLERKPVDLDLNNIPF